MSYMKRAQMCKGMLNNNGKEEITMTNNQETMMAQSTYAEQFNQFTPQEFNNPLFGNLNVLIDQNKQCWFIGVEVARMLRYADPNTIIWRMNQQYKVVVDFSIDNLSTLNFGGNNRNKITLISEKGLMSLIMRSNLLQAQQFQDWVYGLIIGIRQTGSYISPNLKTVLDIDSEQLYRIAKQRDEENIRLRQQIQEQQKFIDQAQPAIHQFDEMVNDEYTIPISIIASNYSLSAQQLNSILHGLRFMFPCGNGWALYEPYRSMGLAKTRTRKAQDGTSYEFILGFNEKGRVIIDKLLHEQNLLTDQEKMFNRNAQI